MFKVYGNRSLMIHASLIGTLLVLFAFTNAQALPINSLPHLKNITDEKSNFFSDEDLTQDLEYNFEGIVQLSNCSGSLISFSGQPDTAKALVMTNGHCIGLPGGFLKPGEVIHNRPLSRNMKLFKTLRQVSNIRADKLLYATMTNTDVAIYQLTKTYKEIENSTTVRPFVIDTVHPTIGLPIEIISGYWKRGYSCDIDTFIFRLQEADWTFTDSIRYTPSCNTIGGTSGSPIIDQISRKIVGINNTGNEKGQHCTMNNPCEVNEEGEINVLKGINYGQQVYNFYGCLGVDFEIDLTKEGCDLPKGESHL